MKVRAMSRGHAVTQAMVQVISGNPAKSVKCTLA